ncbi:MULTISPECIES: YceI family protein [Deinococcus]|uniref:Lipid/polyisoprenoid-binding YceI-like domain-containing protein n=1 Tax=Deinococcus marmoris TaxID=249408 RepID=A0A1U7NYP5_9DEIO|nr:YceI family protein [Deinococcus marmoris]OLV18030.1 hypothetical protein BOO71_0007147 [Deinococcus marmoris]
MKPMIAALLALATAAQAAAPYTASNATVKFSYRVTLIPVNGDANALSAASTLDFARLSATRATVKVDLTSLKTGIALRDRHAREALGAAEFPQAVFTVTGYRGPDAIAAGQTLKAEVTGTFALKGVTRAVTAPVTLTRTGDTLKVNTEFVIHPQEHGVKVTGADQNTTVTATFTLQPGS